MTPYNTWKNVTYVKPNTVLKNSLRWNGELLPNTHGSKMKILQWIMEEWEKKENPLMDLISGREFDSDYEWVMKMIDETYTHEQRARRFQTMDKYHRRLANQLFKKYDGYRNGMKFTK